MNRYAAHGITKDARAGKRVAILSHGARAARCAFNEVAAEANKADRIHRANGAERIDYPGGGTVTFHRSVDSLRGATADTIYLDGEAERHVHESDQWDALRATLAASNHGEVIRA